ncbi:hypothetical protein glysoja_024183 [Glycine soja]|uniref:Retrovirus-related Pol polyprotein from transposon RE1 n=1 Tax=Glycine soja TaxID=3848 RepID=A0A0B2RKI2_GLYSO|nr:hypothetical protein glysoja_024183 [Glycine soja]
MHHLKQTADLLASLDSLVSVEDMTDYLLHGLDDGYRAIIDDRLIYGALLTTLSNEVASLVSQTKTSHDLWILLKNTYAKASRSHLKQLKERLRTASKGTQSITTYMHHLKQTADLLASLGSPVSVEDMTDYVLHGLDDGYRAIIDAVNARDTPINFDDLHERLLIQELSIGAAQRQTPAPLTALNAQARPNSNDKSRHGQNPAQSTQRTGTRKPFLGRCQWCNIKGHVLSQCKTFQQQHPSVPPPPRNSPAHTGQFHRRDELLRLWLLGELHHKVLHHDGTGGGAGNSGGDGEALLLAVDLDGPVVGLRAKDDASAGAEGSAVGATKKMEDDVKEREVGVVGVERERESEAIVVSSSLKLKEFCSFLSYPLE